MDYFPLLKLAVNAAIKGGEEILRIYNTDFDVETKSDNTPVTSADKASGKRIGEALKSSQIPVISEEEEAPEFTVRHKWQQVWIVDPLDGTKEYIKRNGEFTVNIALVENNHPVVGVIYVPVSRLIYFACTGYGSYKIEQHDLISGLTKKNITEHLLEFGRKMPLQKPPKSYTVVASRSHLSREVNTRIKQLENMYGQVDVISVGSSIKQCWVAEGKAHEYPRFGTTMEWDTAAGQCILEQSGNQLVDYVSGLPMKYNKESLRNNYFIAKFSWV